jgi:CRP/FNR family cyclic AMP-dependent transcriptional regulator
MIESKFLAPNERLLSTLKTIPIFEPFREEELRCLLRRSKIRKYTPQEFILQEGRQDAWLYFLVYGAVAISKAGHPILTVNRRGEMLGEMGAFDGSPRSASVQAVEETVCLATDVRQVQRLSGTERTAFGYVLYRIVSAILAERLRDTTGELIRCQTRSRLNPLRWLTPFSGRS